MTDLSARYHAAVRIGATCVNYPANARCTERATGVLFAPNGAPVPSGLLCTSCASAIVDEYAAKLGQTWTFETERPSP
ncbi:MAG: hypothetical protein OXE76_04035 [Alphaproteobacteria bacterium]|nr:hypothetical protein [Alphaproteobacteria bacterium]